MAMRFKFLNNTLQNRRFDYTPMYYDERKERLENKKRQFEKINNGELNDDERRQMFKESMRNEWSRTEIRQSHTRSANLRTILLIGLILALGYFIFYGLEDIDSIVKKIW